MRVSRRRILMLAAAAALSPVSGGAAAAPDFLWTGTALGADAEIRLAGLEQPEATRAAKLAVEECSRLEAAFSLYRPDSELSRLNRDGVLERPSHDFRLLLEQSLRIWEASDGAFNPAIQPAWRFLASHFATSTAAPDPEGLAGAVRHCDPAAITLSSQRIALRPGMALTFNGIAQGYITDAAAAILRGQGLTSVLISLGETLALPGKTWRVGVAGSSLVVPLRDGAIAQSSGHATRFTPDGRWHHLIDPESGASANHLASLTVTAPSAALADALSTALFVAPPERHPTLTRRFAGVRIVERG